MIDVRDGRAVHAKGGRRERYQAVSRAGGTSIDGDARTLASFYRDDCGLGEIYVADLDAIGGGQLQAQLLTALAQQDVAVWLDAGVNSAATAIEALTTGVRHLVIGLETLPDAASLGEIVRSADRRIVALGLDLRGAHPVCATGSTFANDSIENIAIAAARTGVGSIVVLDLLRVGSGDGPPVEAVARVRDAAPGVNVYAAGGVRSIDDLERLERAGVTGALIATALLDGRLGRDELHSMLTR